METINQNQSPQERRFILQSYPKHELAWKYFPGSEKHNATRSLRRWMKNCTGLDEKLKEAGDTAGQKIYSRRQVQIIVDFLGEP